MTKTVNQTLELGINCRGLNQVHQRIDSVNDIQSHGAEQQNVDGVEDHGRRPRSGLDGAIVTGAA